MKTNSRLLQTVLLASLLFFLNLGTAKAETFEVNGIYYFILSKEPEGIVKVVANPEGEPYSGENITIPSTVYYGGLPCKVTSIDPYAFKNSTYSRVTISSPVKSIGQYAFQDCKNLTYVKISEEVTAIQPSTFSGCSSLTDVVMPDGIEQIGDEAFLNCHNLAYIYHYSKNVQNGAHLLGWPTSLTKVGFYSFHGCKFSDIPTSLHYIGDYAFSSCRNLTSVRIPATVSYIGTNPFQGCSGIESIVVDSDNPAYDSRSNCNAIVYTNYDRIISGCKNTTIPSDINSIWERSFYSLDMSSITIGQNVADIGRGAFGACYKLKRVRSLATTPPTCGTDAFGSIYLSSITLYVPNVAKYKLTAPWSEFGNILPLSEWKDYYTITYTIDGEVYATEEVAEGAVIMPKEAPAKNGFILYEWKGLPETMPNNHLTVEAVYTEPITFESDGLWYSLCYKGQVAVIANPSGERYAGNVTIPETVSNEGVEYSVTSIGEDAFQFCSGLTSITIPNSVTSIGDNAFYCCYGLTSITIPNSVTSIGSGAFRDCSSLTSITIPHSVTSIGDNAFRNCSGLTSVTIPNSVVNIGTGPFSGCSGLTSIVVEDGNMVYDSRNNCNALIETKTNQLINGCQSTIIPNSVTCIEYEAFYGCSGLTSITIPHSVTSIFTSAFWGCSGLTSITIPNSVTGIGSHAFRDCSGLTSIVVEDGNTIYDSRNNCNALIETKTNNLIRGCQSTIIPNSITSIEDLAFSDCSGLTSITIPNSVTSIGEGTFSSCSGLTSITIPNSVTSIGESTFYCCSSLTSITIPNSVTSIGSSAFWGCSGLTSITIPNSVTSIGGATFGMCSSLTSITIPNSVTSIGSHAFWDCSSLTSITIPNSVTSIGESTFYCCSGLTSITIPNSVTSIGSHAFWDCSGLTSITIPNSVTSIGSYAFYNCFGLTSITIPNSVTSIGDCAFYYCISLHSVRILATTPPACDVTAFDGTNKPTLYVPEESVEAYRSTSPWNSEFKAILPLKGWEETFEYDGLFYTPISEDKVAVIESQNGEKYSGIVTIPNTVSYDGKNYSVERIAESAFAGCTNLTVITIPQTVTNIGVDAFKDCRKLRYVRNFATTPPVYDGTETVFQSTKLIVYVPEESIELYRSHSSWMLSEYMINSLDNWTKIFVLNGFYYSIISEDGVNMIDNLEGIDHTGDIIIPDTVCYKNKNYAVKSISGTFLSCKNLKSITIPNTVTTIGSSAFEGCTALTNVIIPNSVTTIGSNAFRSCHSLTEMVLPNSVEQIGSFAFNYCRNLVSFTLGGSISNISVTTFANCDKLKRFICYAKHVPTLGYSDGSSSFNDATLYVPEESIDAYKASKSWSRFAYILPLKDYKEYYTITYMVDGVEYAIHEIPEGPTTCPKDAPAKDGLIFMEWRGLPETMPGNNITVEAVYAEPITFEKDGLHYLTIERDKVAVIANPNEGVYYSGSIVIPENVNHDDRNYTVKEISKSAFSDCSELTGITIPKTVTSIDKSSFSGCQNLASIYIENGNAVYDSRENCNAIIETETNTLLRGCNNTVIPNTVAVIGQEAFGNCIGLTSITIPNSVTIVERSAFLNCSNLHTVIIADGEISFRLFVFQGCISLKTVYCYAKEAPKTTPTFSNAPIEEGTLYVPYSFIENYKAAGGWKRFGTILPITHKVTYMVDGEEYATDSVYYDEPIIPIDIPTKEGCIFSGWSEMPDTMPAHDVVVTGSFEADGIENMITEMIVDVYNLQGIKVKGQVPFKELESILPKGMYIVNGNKVVVE